MTPEIYTSIADAVAAEVRRYDERQREGAAEQARTIQSQLSSIDRKLAELYREIRHERELSRADVMAFTHLLQRVVHSSELRELSAPTPPSPRDRDVPSNEPLSPAEDSLPAMKK